MPGTSTLPVNGRRPFTRWLASEATTLRPMLPFLGVGVLFGASYVSLFEAYYRGRVTVVSPIVATESLFGVALSLLLIRHTELVGRRVLAGAVLIVAGGVLIGVYAG